MKNLLIASALLVSVNASASLLTEEASFGTQGSAFDISIGVLNQTLSINGFDTNLGTLTGVGINVYSQMDSIGSSQNVSDVSGRADVGISISQDWNVSTSAANSYIFGAASVTPFMSVASSSAGTFSLLTNDIFNYALSSGELSHSLTGINLSAFTAGTAVDFTFSGKAQTIIDNEVTSGTGLFTNTFNTGSWGKVVVSYTYDSLSVPEPTSVALFGLALVGFSLSRKQKNNA